MKGRLAAILLVGLVTVARSQPLQGSFDPNDREQVLNSAQQWANVQNADSQATPMQSALVKAGKAFNAANAQIQAQKADPEATPESVTAGAAYQLTGVHPTATNAVLSMAKEGVSNAVANLPQALQSFQQAQGGGQPQGFGAVLSGLQSGLQGLIGGPDTTVQTVPNAAMTKAAPAVQSAPISANQKALLSGATKLLATPGEGSMGMSDPMFQAGEPWVGQAAGSAPAGFKAEYIAPSAGENYNALSPAARVQAILNSNPAIVPGAVAFPGRGNGGGLAALAATNDAGTGPAPVSGGAHIEPLGTTFGATLGNNQPGMLSSSRPAATSAQPGGFQSYAQMKPTGGFGIPDTLPQTTVLKTQAGPDKLPITMTFGRKLRL